MRKRAPGGSRADEGVRPTSAGSGAVASGVVFGVAKSGEGFQDSGNFGEAGAGEITSDDFGCDRGGCLHQVIAHGTDAIGEVRRPGKARGAGKPWDRQPVSGKLRRKPGVSPGLAPYPGPPPRKRLSTPASSKATGYARRMRK